MIVPSGALQKAMRTGKGRGRVGMSTSLGSTVTSAPAARARAIAPSTLLVLDQDRFRKLLDRSPRLQEGVRESAPAWSPDAARLSSSSPSAPRVVPAWRADLPDELLPVLNRMLAKNPVDRYAKPSELIRELVRLGERLGLPTALRLEPIWVQPERRPSRTLPLVWMRLASSCVP